MAELSLLLAQHMGLSSAEQAIVHIGAHLHDIGKLGIPDCILDKPGRLTNEEYSIIRRHPVIGGNIVGKLKGFEAIVAIVRHHHEHIDGKGYPDGLRGNDISLGARIVAVADAFDATTTLRSYRQSFSVAAAMQEMRLCAGTQFDPDIIAVLTLLLKTITQLHGRQMDFSCQLTSIS